MSDRHIHFGPFTLIDTENELFLLRGRSNVECLRGKKQLNPLALQILKILIEKSGDIVRIDDVKHLLLYDAPDAQKRSNYAKYVSALSRCLCDDKSEFEQYITTVSKKADPKKIGGYQFVGSVRYEDVDDLPKSIDERSSLHEDHSHGAGIRQNSTDFPNEIDYFFECDIADCSFRIPRRERKTISEIFEGKNARIVFICAGTGGEGKSQLALDWLRDHWDNIGAKGYIFCFSFTNQGSSSGQGDITHDFFEKALKWFGAASHAGKTRVEMAHALANAIIRRGGILYLDGLESLQSLPDTRGETNLNRLLLTLLNDLACQGSHFCLVTTRYQIPEMRRSTIQWLFPNDLHPDDAKKVLAIYDLYPERELPNAAKEWGYHALSLRLLGSYINNYCDKDLRQRDKIPPLYIKTLGTDVRYDPRAMLDAHENRLDNTPELQLLRILSVFDQPVSPDIVWSLASPLIVGVSDQLASLSQQQRQAVLTHLRNLDLVSVKEVNGSVVHLDCHPLVRQHQRTRLQAFKAGWNETNLRLCNYFQNHSKTVSNEKDAIEMLYRAVKHDCAAGFYFHAFEEIYWPKISRREDHFSADKLGLMDKDLACLASFFDERWTAPVPELNERPKIKAQIFGLVGLALRTLGRLKDAEHAIMQALSGFEADGDSFEDASEQAKNLAILYRTQGYLPKAIKQIKKALKHSKKVRANPDVQTRRIAALAEFYHYMDRLPDARKLFKEAERRQTKYHPMQGRLGSTLGYRYCSFLLTLNKFDEVKDRVKSIVIKGEARDALLSNGLALLCEGRALVQDAVRNNHSNSLQLAEDRLTRSVAFMKESHHLENEIRACCALAECLRIQKKLDRAEAIVQEATEIATFSEMHLHRLDCEFEHLRIMAMRIPLQGLIGALDTLEQGALEMDYRLLARNVREFRNHEGSNVKC